MTAMSSLSVASALGLTFSIGLAAHAAPLDQSGLLERESRAAQVTRRPCHDFLSAQGIQGPTFFAYHNDFLGWAGGDWKYFALIDYANITGFSSTPTCLVLETAIFDEQGNPNGAEINIELQNRKALGFAQYIDDILPNYDFDNAPTIFGNKAEEVAGGAEPAFGPVHFSISFVDPDGPGAPLPDLMDVVSNHPADYAPVTLRFNSTTVGTWEDGTQAVLRVKQVTAANANGEYGTEIVTITPDQ